MLGVAAEAEFLRLISVADRNAKLGTSFEDREGEIPVRLVTERVVTPSACVYRKPHPSVMMRWNRLSWRDDWAVLSLWLS
jgi:hypothetical protein